VPNWSDVSNVVSTTTLSADTSQPDAITDLAVSAVHIHTVYLTWTAPADNGAAGMGSYDLRYSTFDITEGNWPGATQVADEPIPAAPGQPETFLISGLDPDTTYYFAIKSSDLAEPANVSDLSNVPSGDTAPPVAPVVIRNPWIVNDRVADCRTMTTIGQTFVNSYQPDGVTLSTTDEEKAVNCYDNVKRRMYHWGGFPPDYRDTVHNLNVFGWALCGSHATWNTRVLLAAGLTNSRKVSIDGGGHTCHEAYYDGGYHFYDTMCTFYVFTRDVPPHVANCVEMGADHSLVLQAVAEGRACPGFLLCGDDVNWYANAMDNWAAMNQGEVSVYSMDMDLPIGTVLERTDESLIGQYCPNGPHYHREAQYDWKDAVNIPYWEPYVLYGYEGKSVTYRRHANGYLTLEPDFRSAGYQAAVESSSGIATYNDDALTPELHVAAVRSTAEVVFKVDSSFYMTDGWIDGTFYRTRSADVVRVYVSDNGINWTQVWDDPQTGATTIRIDIRSQVFSFSSYWVKIEMYADADITDVGVSDLVISSIIEHNKGAMAYLDKGVNNISVTLDNPGDLAAGVAFKVTYQWKEYDGADWTIDRQESQYITASPTNFSITTGGSRAPKTESITMEVTAPPMPDGTAPAPITDLAALNPDSTTVDLTWTAPGDDWDQGRAVIYDIRYSTSPINEGNWDGAIQVADEPAPQTAGNTEYFTVTGLSSSTTYYFAIKTSDEGGNIAGLSNTVSETTNPPDVTPPAAITDLFAFAGTESGSADLLWSAPGDDGSTGTAAGYDIRYSTSLITEANFAAAAQVDGEPDPQSAGNTEWLTLTGLDWGQLYYFAIKTSDEVPNQSALSNVPTATAANLGEVTFQNGLGGYSGVQDTYLWDGQADNDPYGASVKMTLCGFDVGDRQRPLLKFDVSSIPPGTTITSAVLMLYMYEEHGGSGDYVAYETTTAWAQASATWNLAATGQSWTTSGGDYNPAAEICRVAKNPTAVNDWMSFDITAAVQQWINSPAGNLGIIIKADNEAALIANRFHSSDYVTQSLHPKLVVSDL
jgi:hypothetical protein